jgi:hypothetical protein
MTRPQLFNATVVARIALTVLFVAPLFLAFTAVQYAHERTQRVAAVAATQRQLDAAVHANAVNKRDLVAFKNGLELTNCQEANRRAHATIDETFRRDAEIAVLARLSRDATFAFIAADLRVVIRANPKRDCSPKVLGLEPLPPVPPLITSDGPPGTRGTTVPLAHRAGTKARPTTTVARRQPHPPHPPHP